MHRNISTDEAIKLLKGDDNADWSWSWSGAQALVEYIEDIESDENIRIEFDRVAFRCEFSEYSSALKAAQDYGFIPEEEDDEDDIESSAITYLEDKTTVIKFEGGVIIQQF